MKRKKLICIFMLIVFLTCMVLLSIFSIFFLSAKKGDNHYWSQWALDNDGTFEFSGLDDKYIYTYSYNSVEGIDIGYNAGIQMVKQKRSIIIAVIDSGVQYNHDAFNNSIWINKGEIPQDGVDNDNNGYIDDVYGWNFHSGNNDIGEGANETDHGTHIVGTLCAYGKNSLVKGVLGGFDFDIMCLKILDEKGNGDVADLKKAIIYAENNGADICCLSIDSDYDSELEAYIKQSNMLFVVSAGNDGKNIDNEPVYPASYDSNNIVVVANVCSDGQLNDTSNYGVETVDISAPGTDIISTAPLNSYIYKTGTSMSVPFVAGVIALTYCNSDTVDLVTAKDIVLQSAKKMKNLKSLHLQEGYRI